MAEKSSTPLFPAKAGIQASGRISEYFSQSKLKYLGPRLRGDDWLD